MRLPAKSWPAWEAKPSTPTWLGESGLRGGEAFHGNAEIGLEQPPFVLAASRRKIPGKQEDTGKVKVRGRIVGAESDRLSEGGDGLVEMTAVAQGLSRS